MAGTYIEGQSQALSGVYSLVKATSGAGPSADIGVVAIPFAANWGPVNKLVAYASQKEFGDANNAANSPLSAKKVYTLAYADPTYKPNKLLGYRMATSAAAKGTASVPSTGTAWVLATAYPTDRAFSIVVKTGVGAGTTAVQIVEAGVVLWGDESDTTAGLAAKLNASGVVTVTTVGTALPTITAGISVAGGNNGSVVTATEYAAFLAEVEVDTTANAIVFDGVTDEPILTTFKTWLLRVRGEGFYLEGFRGGLASWDTDLTLPNAVSTAANARGWHNVGNGVDGYTSADMAIFVAAYTCSRPMNTSVTDQITPFVTVNSKTPLTVGNRKLAKAKGTIIFVMKSGKVVIDEGVNTLTAPTGDEVAAMGKMRVSRTIDYISRATEAFGEEYKKTKSNTTPARQAFAALIEDSFFRGLVRDEIIQAAFSYKEDPDYHGPKATKTAKVDEAFFVSEYWPTDSMERVYQKFGVRF